MARINLLPWREERRKQLQQEFLTAILFAAGVTAAIMFYVHVHVDGLIQNQNERNDFLRQEITQLDKKIGEINQLDEQKSRLVSKMNVIQDLQTSRPEIVHLFDEMAKTIPDGVFLKSFAQSGNKLTLKGTAQSNARVSAYMRNIDASKWLTNPNLKIIEAKGKATSAHDNNFILELRQDKPKKEVATKKGGGKA